ncbi:B-cell receptor CD22-like [Pseudochaenichthys georgianus]|uniref:B-cell receptor CD22-like n=1 Tax=Pseudochaenichthys georgianus TaxID=52239 RepID=UPI00146DB3B6|nr:B-cell receptor CD22-like [Pseudochaenichthys georgianus]XP_033945541.1 B-cell receptor CD22-like [Pseudochaenichthys georgianus]
MSLTAATRGFVVFLLSAQVVQGQNGWRVTYTSTEICAVKGSTVEIGCSYTPPSGPYFSLRKGIWFTKINNGEFVDLSSVSDYAGRVQYSYNNRDCTLRISDLRESDSAEYWFRSESKQEAIQYTGSLGVTLSVTGVMVQVQMSSRFLKAELKCQSSCRLPDSSSYVWYKNERVQTGWISSSYSVYYDPHPADNYSCAVNGHENHRSPSVYPPKLPSVSVSPSAETEEGSAVTLTCSSDANPAASYTWYKKDGKPILPPFKKGPQLVFSSIHSSDSGQYYCSVKNKLGRRTSKDIFIHVKYAPKPPSVSVSASAEREEGSAVTLTCSCDANPAASYTWYKENRTVFLGAVGSYHFTSISSEDRGNYYCRAENQYGEVNSTSLFVDVQYAPKPPSVSVSPSAEREEGSSVTLTCSSDANPAANYTWYKEDEDSPKASGQIFTITYFRAEHSGSYSCGAQNKLGRSNSTLHQIILADESIMIMNITRLTLMVEMLILLLLFCLLMRKEKAVSFNTELNEPIETWEFDPCPVYENVSDLNMVSAEQTEEPGEQEDLV